MGPTNGRVEGRQGARGLVQPDRRTGIPFRCRIGRTLTSSVSSLSGHSGAACSTLGVVGYGAIGIGQVSSPSPDGTSLAESRAGAGVWEGPGCCACSDVAPSSRLRMRERARIRPLGQAMGERLPEWMRYRVRGSQQGPMSGLLQQAPHCRLWWRDSRHK